MEKNDKKKNVIILSSHFVNQFIIQKIKKLQSDLNTNIYDIILLLNIDDGCEWNVPDDILCFTTNCESTNELGYEPIDETLIPGSCHFPMLRFYKGHPSYEFYWLLEYDVMYTGNWSTLMDECDKNLSEYDFLSCHIEKFDENKNKYWPW